MSGPLILEHRDLQPSRKWETLLYFACWWNEKFPIALSIAYCLRNMGINMDPCATHGSSSSKSQEQ